MSTLQDELSLPKDWFLYSLKHFHTPVTYAGDKYHPVCWEVAAQHRDGGRFKYACADSPEEALLQLVNLILEDEKLR